jgi:uncharacterized phiE125 gp8 family phage protein
MANLEEVTAPATTPVTTAEAKSFMRVDISDDDTLINSFIQSATEQVQTFIGRQLVTATYDYFADSWELTDKGYLEIPLGNVASITSIKYKDTDEVLQTWSSSKYEVNLKTQIVQIRPISTENFPSLGEEFNSVEIRFTAGYGAASDVPDALKTAIYMLVADSYEHREHMSEVRLQKNPAVERILWNYRLRDFY